MIEISLVVCLLLAVYEPALALMVIAMWALLLCVINDSDQG